MKLWCRAQWPLTVRTAVGCATERLFVRVWVDGVTPTRGIDAPMVVEVGYGPRDHAPTRAAWKWSRASYNREFTGDGNNDEFMGSITALAEGTWGWAARVRVNDHVIAYSENTGQLVVGPRGHLRIATLNLRGLQDDWRRRAPLIIEALRKLRPDVVAFQECGFEPGGINNLEPLIAQAFGAKAEACRAMTHFAFDRYEEGLALVAVAPTTLADWRGVDLPRGDFGRKLLLARVRTDQGPLVIGCTHLELRSPEVRVRQAATVVKAVGEFAMPGERVVVAGDFNDPAPGVTSSTLRQAGWIDVWDALNLKQPGYTFPAHAPNIRIDYLWWHGNQDGYRPITVETFLSHPARGVFGSDHLGVCATIHG